METNNSIPNNLREIRKSLGMRQMDVAARLSHASPDRISHWEKGLALPGAINLFKLSIIYGVRPELLYAKLYESIAKGLLLKNGQESASEEDSGSSPSLVQPDQEQNIEKTQ